MIFFNFFSKFQSFFFKDQETYNILKFFFLKTKIQIFLNTFFKDQETDILGYFKVFFSGISQDFLRNKTL